MTKREYVLFDSGERVFVGSAGPIFFQSAAEAKAHAERLRSQEGLRADPKEYATVAVPAQ